jgi:hypothetical protein
MFTYQFGANPTVDFIRLLLGDTQCDDHIFEDSEIESAYAIQAATFQSGQFYSGTMGRNLPSTPVSYYRVAAILLDSLASNRSRIIGGLSQLLDVKLAPEAASKTAAALRAQAKEWRDIDDNSGAFVIVEQVTTSFSFRERFFNQIQRQVGT